jgi:Ser/Thr protein kinase RdoA (MazF antagonist)
VLAKDPVGRVREARAEIEFARDREEMTGVLEAERCAGRMPERVTHNDTKINNVLFDLDSGEAVTVVDLDTVMPGVALYDFGDLVRTCVSPAAGDERDLEKVAFRPEIYEALVEGFTGAVGSLLTEAEHDLLFFSGKLITFETGLRFLADFLSGDTYFRTSRPGQNLDRARTKFELLRRLEEVDPGP